MFKSIFGQQKPKAVPTPYVPANDAFWAAQAANAKKGAQARAEANAVRARNMEEEAKKNAAFNAYRKSPEYAKTIKNLDRSERNMKQAKEAEMYGKNPYGAISGVRLRKSRRNRKTRRSRH